MSLPYSKLLFVALIMLASQNCFAQLRPWVSLGGEVGIPMGQLNNTQSLGLGGSAKFGLAVAHDMDITLSAGIINFSGDKMNSFAYVSKNFIPVKAGVRYRLTPTGIYIEPQLGYTRINPTIGKTSGGFTYAAAAGLLLRSWDVSARYEGVSKNDNTLPFAGVRIAYVLGL